MEKPKTSHYMEAKRILRYIKETNDYGLLYATKSNEGDAELVGFTDVDWCGDKDDKKRIPRAVFMINKSPFSWCSKKQSLVTFSTCEAEYVVASMGACQTLWLDELLT
ncbi:secreted RxLR effector protein 161-like [Cicer arietinum]|uniref:secreted RxLR effector protein 161-like n=1 Tax=Cicer arietinum TaxID=3827 RepID=UPI003CC67F0E